MINKVMKMKCCSFDFGFYSMHARICVMNEYTIHHNDIGCDYQRDYDYPNDFGEQMFRGFNLKNKEGRPIPNLQIVN